MEASTKKAAVGLPLLVVLATIFIGWGDVGGVTRGDKHDEPPNGLRRMVQTLEGSGSAKACCGTATSYRVDG